MRSARKDNVNVFGWDKNPFTFKILPDIFIGYENEIDTLESGIMGNSKVLLLLGPTGSGKTTLLKHLIRNRIEKNNVIYLPKPPKNPMDFIDIFSKFTDKSFFERLFSRKSNVNLYNLSEKVNNKIGDEELLLVIDEAHESTIDTMEWLRTISDQIDGMTLLMAGLPVLENKMKSELETFYRRVDNTVKLTSLSQMESRELIKRRIEWAGGEGLKPFTSRMVDHIYESTGGFPREVLRMCNEYSRDAARNNITIIDIDSHIESREPKIKSAKKHIQHEKEIKNEEDLDIYEKIEEMSKKQRDIVDILATSPKGLTPTEIVQKMDMKNYKNKDNAIRSVNNILRRMGSEGSVMRYRKGKAYKYRLSEKLRTATVRA